MPQGVPLKTLPNIIVTTMLVPTQIGPQSGHLSEPEQSYYT